MLRQTVEPASAAATATATRIAPAGRSARTAARRITRSTGIGARMSQRKMLIPSKVEATTPHCGRFPPHRKRAVFQDRGRE